MSTHSVLRPLLLTLTLLAMGTPAHPQETPLEPATAASSASPGAPVLVGTYPLPGEAFERKIVFYFDQPLVEAADPSTLIQLDPNLPGTWTQQENIVAFEVQKGTGIQRGLYRATYLPSLTNTSGQMPTPPEKPLLFANAILSMTRFGYGTMGPVSSALGLEFTLPLRWEQLQQHLTIKDNAGNAVQYDIPQRTAATQFVVVVPSTSTPPFTAVASEGLTDSSGLFQTSTPEVLTLDAPQPFSLSKVEWTQLDETTDRLQVTVSHPVPFDSLVSHFQL